MTVSIVNGPSDHSGGLLSPVLPVGETRLIEVFGNSELVGTSDSSGSATGGESSSIQSISLVSASGEPAAEDEDDDIPLSSMARMHASISRLE